MNQLTITFNEIVLKVGNPLMWEAAKRITGRVEDKSPGEFTMSLSTQNLQRIHQMFANDLPVIVKGHEFLDRLKERLRQYKIWKQQVQDVLSKERYPVPPNGKFIPYAHQTRIIGTALSNPFAPIFADCGLGKTGSMARAFEILLDDGQIERGKILVSAPLSILHTSWLDDIDNFTELKATILWTPEANKQALGGERVALGTFPPRQGGGMSLKSKTGVRYRNRLSGEVREKITSLDRPDDWDKYRATWKVEVMLTGEEVPFGEIWGRTARTEKTREQFITDQLARTDVDVYLINHDGVRIYEQQLKDHKLDWVVVDESTKIKSPKSKVFRSHTSISWHCKRRNVLSGTPNPNGFIDLWSQFYFLDRGLTLEPALKDFLGEYFRAEVIGFAKGPRGGKQAVKYYVKDAETRDRLVQRVRSTGVYLEQRDCIDLPPRTDMKRIMFMTAEQEAAYDRMAIDLVTELKHKATDETVEADAENILTKIMKLRQITSGFLMNRDGEVAHLADNPKLTDLDDFIEELGTKKIVLAAQFTEEIDSLVDRYRHLGACKIDGNIKDPLVRAASIRRFQSDDLMRVIVLQPQACSHGVTLTAAAHLGFLSLDYNFEYYYQMAKRIERIGQKQPMFIHHWLARYRDGGPTIDEDLLEVLQNKKTDRDALFSPDDEIAAAKQLSSALIKQVEERHGK